MNSDKLNYVANLFDETYRILDARIAKMIYENGIDNEKYVFLIRDGYADLYNKNVETYETDNEVYKYAKTEKAIYIEIKENMDTNTLENDDFLLANMIYGEDEVTKKVNEHSKLQLHNAITQSLKIDRDNILQKTEELKNTIRHYLKNIAVMSRDIDELRGRLNQEQEIEHIREKITDEIEKIIKHKDVEKVYVANNVLHIKTKDIYITEHFTGRRYYLGKMLIKINVVNNYIQFDNTNNKREGTYWGGYANHPHVNGAGDPCLGNIDAQICQFLTEKEYYATFITALNYLQQADIEDGAGYYVCVWDEVDENGNIIKMGHQPNGDEYGDEDNEDMVECCICENIFHDDDLYMCQDCGRLVCNECSTIIDDLILCADCANERRNEEA